MVIERENKIKTRLVKTIRVKILFFFAQGAGAILNNDIQSSRAI